MSTDTRESGTTTPGDHAAAGSPAPPRSERRTRKPASLARRGKRRLNPLALGGIIVVLAILALGGIFYATNVTPSSLGPRGSSQYPFDVGSPGPGAKAPPIKLSSTDGTTFDLGALQGQTVLLYFQEGITCQPCWDQLKDIQTHRAEFQALGIDRIVSVTTDPLDALKQKVADEQLTLPVLSDPNLDVSRAYQANQYGMMGTSRDGHSFIMVDKTGMITWRADYGGAPKYTMYVPVPVLLDDIRQGLKGSAR